MRWRSELLLFGAAYLLYNAGRGITSGQMDLAIANADWVIEAQGGTGVERSVQDALGGLWMTLLSHIYLAAQIVVLPGVLVAMYRWAPRIYPRLRDTVIATWMLSLPIYALFPVAPPRLAGLGMTDAVSETSAVALAGHSTWFYNPIAAVPSLHCGFAMAIGVALAAATRRRWLQVLALSWGPIVALSTVATANHYVFDVAAGLAVTAARLCGRPAPPSRGSSAASSWRWRHDPRRRRRPAPRDLCGRERDPRRARRHRRRRQRRRPPGAVAAAVPHRPRRRRTRRPRACRSPSARGTRARGSSCTSTVRSPSPSLPASRARTRWWTRRAARASWWRRSVASSRSRPSPPARSGRPPRRSAAPTARSWRCAWPARRTARSPAPSASIRARSSARLAAIVSGAAVGPLDRASELHAG